MTSTDDAAAATAATASDYEQAHVHSVYAAIAPHFSATRTRAWPRVTTFLDAQPAGAVGVDIGCGNGKYLGQRGSGGSGGGVVVVGCDRSAELAALARGRLGGAGGADEVVVADGLAPPFAAGRADFALCIAVAHHLSTPARRRELLRRTLACLRVTAGRALVCVWALEQAGSRRGWDESDAQDRFVPWVVPGVGGDTYQRYYHLYRQGELEADIEAAGGRVEEAGYERDNWWVVCSLSHDLPVHCWV